MEKLPQYQRKFLKGQAHHLKPSVQVGQKGFTDALIEALDDALTQHELIKVKFIAFKEGDQKKEILEQVETATGAHVVGLIGHIAILFRQNRDPEKRKIKLPVHSDDSLSPA